MKTLKLEPEIKNNIWGGTFFQKFGKGTLMNRVAECWELSMQPNSESIISSGINKGKRLNQVLTNKEIGPVSKDFPYFPLLIKLIDAKDDLSVQVHPSDDYALENEHSFGKSEMWYILGHEKGAGLYVGFNKDYSKEEIEESLNTGNILDKLNFYEVNDGDCFEINPGTIHAIGKGVRLIEIQQNSNLTYRLFDYFRKDDNGNYRELHIDKALKVINYKKFEKKKNNGDFLAKNKYFTVKKIDFTNNIMLKSNDYSFSSITFIDGEGKINDLDFKKYDTFFIPVGEKIEIFGSGTLIFSTVEK